MMTLSLFPILNLHTYKFPVSVILDMTKLPFMQSA